MNINDVIFTTFDKEGKVCSNSITGGGGQNRTTDLSGMNRLL